MDVSRISKSTPTPTTDRPHRRPGEAAELLCVPVLSRVIKQRPRGGPTYRLQKTETETKRKLVPAHAIPAL